jgi:hypothetical protein
VSGFAPIQYGSLTQVFRLEIFTGLADVGPPLYLLLDALAEFVFE